MSLFSTLFDLLKGGPRNIKRRLLRDVLLILFVTSGAIISFTMVQELKTQRDISTTIINKANKSVRNHFQAFLEPLSLTLSLLAKWGEAGLLKQDDVKLLATQFHALMEIFPTTHAITIADADTFAIRLSRNNDQFVIIEHRNGMESVSYWKDRKILGGQEKTEKSYSAGREVWFRGAINGASVPGYFLSEPHTLEDTNLTGVTASRKWSPYNSPESVLVVAISFTMNDLMTFMAQFETTLNDQTLLLEKDGTLLSNLKYNDLPTNKQSAAHPAIAKELMEKVTQILAGSNSQGNQAVSLKYQKKTWWLGLSPLIENSDDIWVAVLIPEDDIFKNLQAQWKRFALLVGAILLCGIIMTIFLVRRYSHQLKDLPQQHVNMLSYEHEIRNLIRAGESTSLEFKSTMRTNLRTGKPGKEIELAWLKAVAGFMNSDGGILLIGVADDGEILGLDVDNFANEDKCRLHFKNLLNTHIGAEFTRFISLKVVAIEQMSILIIECERVRRPVFLSVGKNEDFFIRSGPSSTKLSMSQMVKYLSER